MSFRTDILADILAVSTFGKFPEDTILSLHSRILAHQAINTASSSNGQRRRSDHSPPRMMGARGAGGEKEEVVDGMDHEYGDVLASEPRRKGGLVRSGNVGVLRDSLCLAVSLADLNRCCASGQADQVGHNVQDPLCGTTFIAWFRQAGSRETSQCWLSILPGLGTELWRVQDGAAKQADQDGAGRG